MDSARCAPAADGFTLTATVAGYVYHGFCFICGSLIDLGDCSVELRDAAHERIGIVCPRCVEAGDRGAAEEAQRHSRRLRRQAEILIDIARVLESPRTVLPKPDGDGLDWLE